MRGIDNAAYYRLMPDDRRFYMDYTGTGNTLNMRQPARAAADHGQPALLGARRCTSTASGSTSPRALARELHEVDRLGAFFDIIQQDPVLSQVKLIAEPWDLGEGGYQVGNFPRAVGGVERPLPRLRSATLARRRPAGCRRVRVRGSPAAATSTRQRGRRPHASINFITAHDGFTLRDLVSYNEKHNEANGEDNRDGENAQPELELRRRGADRRPGDRRAARAAAAQPPRRRCSSPRACRCCSAATRWGAPSSGNNNALLPGQRDLAGSTGTPSTATCSSSPGPRRVPQGAQVFRRRSSSRAARCTAGGRRHRLVQPETAR